MHSLRRAAETEWTKESDTALLNEMRSLSLRVLARVNSTSEAVDLLVMDGARCEVRVRDACNRFRQLADLTHVERRFSSDGSTDDADYKRRASVDASTSGGTHQESSNVESRYRNALALTIAATRGKWLLPLAPPRVVDTRDEGTYGQGEAQEHEEHEEHEELEEHEEHEELEEAHKANHLDREEQIYVTPTQTQTVPPPKLIGNRFWRPLPHVIGTRRFYHDENVTADWSPEIAPDQATANAVMGVVSDTGHEKEKKGAHFGTFAWDPARVDGQGDEEIDWHDDDRFDSDDVISDTSGENASHDSFSTYAHEDGTYDDDAWDTHMDTLYVRGGSSVVDESASFAAPGARGDEKEFDRRLFSDTNSAASTSPIVPPNTLLASINPGGSSKTHSHHRSPKFATHRSPARVRWRLEKEKGRVSERDPGNPCLSPKPSTKTETFDFKKMMEATLRDPEVRPRFDSGKGLFSEGGAFGNASKETGGGLFDDDETRAGKGKEVSLSVEAIASSLSTKPPMNAHAGGLFDDDEDARGVVRLNKPETGLFADESD